MLTKDEKFLVWMKLVNAALIAKCGLDSEELPDWRYRDAFDNGYSPKRAANAAFAYAKNF